MQSLPGHQQRLSQPSLAWSRAASLRPPARRLPRSLATATAGPAPPAHQWIRKTLRRCPGSQDDEVGKASTCEKDQSHTYCRSGPQVPFYTRILLWAPTHLSHGTDKGRKACRWAAVRQVPGTGSSRAWQGSCSGQHAAEAGTPADQCTVGAIPGRGSSEAWSGCDSAVEPGMAAVRVSTQQWQGRRLVNAQWGQYLGWVRLKPGAAAAQDGGLRLRAHRLRIAAAAPLLPAFKAPAMVPAEQLPVLHPAHAQRCKPALRQ